jgi:hypothetical protein
MLTAIGFSEGFFVRPKIKQTATRSVQTLIVLGAVVFCAAFTRSLAIGEVGETSA